MNQRIASIFVAIIIVIGLCNTQIFANNAAVSPMIAASECHTVLLKSDGTVWTWGDNRWGQLGDGTFKNSYTPVKVDIDDVVQIAAGTCFDAGRYDNAVTYALKNDGTVWAWGRNQKGQLGIGNYNNQNTPVKVDIADVIQIKAGHNFALALKNDGTVWYWGNTFYFYEMGLSATTIPRQITAIDKVMQIEVGTYHMLYLKEDGSLWTQGWNWSGQLGDGTTNDRSYPVKINIDNVKLLCDNSNTGYSVVIKDDNTLWACGPNTTYQISQTVNYEASHCGAYEPYFRQVHNEKYLHSSYGSGHAIAINELHQLETWGSNKYGLLGLGVANDMVSNSSNIIMENVLTAKAALLFTVAIDQSGNVYTWGRNNYGQLGNGTTKDVYSPIKIDINVYGNLDGASSNSTSEGAPIITSALLSYNGATYDLFNQSHSVDKDSAEIMSVEAYVNTNGCEDVHVYITQGAGKSVEIPLNSYIDIKIGEEFSPGEPIYMLAVDNATGKSSSKRTKLSVTGTQMFEGGLSTEAIDLFDDFSVEIPESVPILGKEKIGLSLGSISVDAETDGNEFKVALGTDVFEHRLDSNGKWQEEAWQGLKEGFKEAKNSGLENSVRYLNAYGSETNLDISKGVSGKANVSGYLEGYFDENGGMHVSEGGIIVEGEIKYTYQGMVVVYVVPLYYEIGAGGGLEFVGGVRDLVSGGGLQGAFTGSLAPSISFEAGGGVGVPKVLTAGVSGKVKAELEIALDKIYQKLDVTGSASFKLTGPFGIPTYQKDFAKGTFNIYETGNPNTLLGKVGLYSEEYDINNLYVGIDIDSPIGTAPHDDSVQKWVGDKEQAQLMADYTNQTVQVLEEDSYENIAPAFAQMGGKNVIAWITDNKNRPDEDKTMLVYSVFENGVWSAPQAVYDDGLADYSPVMKDGYIVWQKATDHISADMTSRELGEICELYLAKWNGSSFNEPIRVTENSLIDQTPVLAVSNGEPAVVWVQNSANDFTGLTGENRIMSYENGETTIAVTEENVVTYIDCAYIDGELDIVYETDGDKDLYTIDDREIYTVSEGQITSNELPDTHPVYADFNGETVLFYYSNGSIVYIENGTEKTVINGTASIDQFTVVSNSGSAAVLWTAVSDGSAEIHGSLYDGTMWSEDVRISDLGQRIKYPFAVMNADGSIFAAFNRTEKVSDGGDYYVDGQSDLCTINIVPSYDLEITDAYFDEAAMTAYATVKNSGELSIGGFNITLTDSDVVFVTDELKAGTSVDVEIPYSVPDDMSLRTVALGVELIEGEEYNIENNTAEFEIGHADIVVKNVAVNETGTEVTADISNEGYENAQNVRVQIREDSADGEILAEKILELSIGGTQTVVFAVDKESMLLDDERKQLYVTAEGDFSEISLGNNDGYAYMSNISSLPDYETEILNYSEINGEYMINSIARNNTDSAITCQLYSAVYAADGTLKACGIEAVSIAAEDDTGVDISVPCIIETGDTIKTFMWNEQMPLCKASELTVE